MTPSMIDKSIRDAKAHAIVTGRPQVYRIVTSWGMVIDSGDAGMHDGKLRLVDGDGVLIFIDPAYVALIAGGLRPGPVIEGAEIEIQQGDLVTPQVTQ